MNKLTKGLLEKYGARSGGEAAFINMHLVSKHADRNGNGDDVFNGDIVSKDHSRKADKTAVDTTSKDVTPEVHLEPKTHKKWGAQPDMALKDPQTNGPDKTTVESLSLEENYAHVWHPHVVKERKDVAETLHTTLHHDTEDHHVGYVSMPHKDAINRLKGIGYNHTSIGGGEHDFTKQGEHGVTHTILMKKGFGGSHHISMNHYAPSKTNEDVKVELIDGSSFEIESDLAESIKEVFDSLDEDNQEMFEHLLHESIESFDKAVEFVTELSKKTMHSYIHKATDDVVMKAVDHGSTMTRTAGSKSSKDFSTRQKQRIGIIKRINGIKLANQKIQKEEKEAPTNESAVAIAAGVGLAGIAAMGVDDIIRRYKEKKNSNSLAKKSVTVEEVIARNISGDDTLTNDAGIHFKHLSDNLKRMGRKAKMKHIEMINGDPSFGTHAVSLHGKNHSIHVTSRIRKTKLGKGTKVTYRVTSSHGEVKPKSFNKAEDTLAHVNTLINTHKKVL